MRIFILVLSFLLLSCHSDYELYPVVDKSDPGSDQETPITTVDEFPPLIEIVPEEPEDAPDIEVNPIYWDFGELISGCPELKDIVISNVGTLDLEVTDFLFSTTGDMIYDPNGNGAFPWIIPPGESRTIIIEFDPTNEQSDFSVSKIFSNDPDEPVVDIDTFGDEVRDGTIVDSWIQEEVSKTDILFVIDNSGSMNQEHNHLSNHTEDFINQLDLMAADYQIAVITTDNENFVGPIISYSDSDRTLELSSQIDSIGYFGSPLEKPFDMAEDSTSPGGDATTASGFIRSDSILSIIVVTDEDDHSSNNETYFTAYFESLKPSSSELFVHAVAGPPSTSGCHSTSGGADSADKIDAVVTNTSGIFVSICDSDWGVTLSTLASASTTSQLRFTLSEMPIEETIIVRIDGVLTTTGWTYDSGTNQLVFTASSAPFAGQEIQVEYGKYGSC